MAHMQYFKKDYKDGLLCGCHLKSRFFGKKFEFIGNFIVMGGCDNIWI
jgi:hypothetical protein